MVKKSKLEMVENNTNDINDFTDSFMKSLGDPDIHLADEALSSSEFSGHIDTGCYIFNAQISGSLFGGVQDNKTIVYSGDSGVGKTFMALGTIKHFLDSNPKNLVFYFDTEAAVNREMFVSRNIDPKRVIIIEPTTVQMFRTKVMKILSEYAKRPKETRPNLFFVLDSMGGLSTTKEIEDSTDGKDTRDMTRAQLLKSTFRVIRLEMAKLKVPMIVTNHVYSIVGSYIPTKTQSGGTGLVYASDCIVNFSKSKDKEDGQVVGVILKSRMEKARLSKEQTTVELKLSYKTGLDRYYGLLDLAEEYNVVEKIGNKFTFPDGRRAFRSEIEDNPESYWTQEMLDMLEDCAKDKFSYGSHSGPEGLPEENNEMLDKGEDNAKSD